jgi:hypothetical protein
MPIRAVLAAAFIAIAVASFVSALNGKPALDPAYAYELRR